MTPSTSSLLRGSVVAIAAASLVGCSAVPFHEANGCPSWQLGHTLPSPGMLRNDPQYFPKGLDDFPLQAELDAQQAEAERDASR